MLYGKMLIMDKKSKRRRGRTSIWLIFGAGILILLLLVWLTIADFDGNTSTTEMISLFPWTAV